MKQITTGIKGSTKKPWSYQLPIIILVAGNIIQITSLATSYIIPWGEKIWNVRSKSATERTGELYPYIDDEQTQFLIYLQGEIPPDSTLIFTDSERYSWKPVLQYFLIPREVIIIKSGETLDALSYPRDNEIYFIQFPGFPAIENPPSGAKFVTVNGSSFGYYITPVGD